MLIVNTEYEILTPQGFCNFDGLVKKNKKTLKITFTDTTFLVCTYNHLLFYKNDWICANTIKPNFILSKKRVVSIEENGYSDVYDPVNVQNVNNEYYSNELISHNCEFHGSASTLIEGKKLSTIPFFDPIIQKDNLKIYEEPKKGHPYICTVDTSRGLGLDFSAFIIFDVSTVPYKIVATYKDNNISLSAFPTMIMNTARQYFNAYLLIEVNDAGQGIANDIFYELEYENCYFTNREKLVEGAGYPGVRTTKRVKSVGCSTLKELVEGDQLIINSYDVIQELSVFEQKGSSFAASDTQIQDDLTSCAWLFSWLVRQPIFADLTDTNIRKILAAKHEAYILENMSPFGYYSDGTEEYETTKPIQNLDAGFMTLENWINS